MGSQVIAELARLRPGRDVALTIGVFDGVHRGHQFLIQELRRLAQEEDLLSAVLTFHPHPRLVLSAQNQLPYLSSLEDRIQLLKGLGIELIVTLPFTQELSQLSAWRFMALMQNHLRIRQLVIGPDFALGRGREGNPAVLQALGKELGFGVHVVAPFAYEGEVVSSTAIRCALAEGDMLRAARLLGRYVGLRGRAVLGAQRSRSSSLPPTANLDIDPSLALPSDGIYVCRAYLGYTTYGAVANIGRRPTFEDGERKVEVHLLDFEGDLYGQELRVELIQRLRDEVRFRNAEELVAQINLDIQEARQILEGWQPPP